MMMIKRRPREWLLAGMALLFAATLACSQYAPESVATVRAPSEPAMHSAMMPAPAPGQDPQAGRKVFDGKGICYTCHGVGGKGTPLGPDLTDAEWINTDGSLEGIEAIVKSGVPKPVKHPAPMPPMGGAKLSPEEVAAVAAYVHSLSQKK